MLRPDTVTHTVASHFNVLRHRYTEAFTIFDDVLRDNADVLVVTGFSALVMWVLFASLLYVKRERTA